MVDHTPGDEADHWCNRGLILRGIAGERPTELADLRERIAALEATVGERPALSSGTVAEPPSLPRGGAAR